MMEHFNELFETAFRHVVAPIWVFMATIGLIALPIILIAVLVGAIDALVEEQARKKSKNK